MELHSQLYDQDLVAHLDPLSHVTEAIKIIRTNIEFSSIDKPIRTLAVTSTLQGEGKTALIGNLAITYAQAGRKVLLIDADLRRPTTHRLFGLSNRRGLTNVLVSGRDYKEFMQQTLTENLFLLASGPIPPNPAEILMSATFTSIIEQAKSEFDMVFLDTPPINVVTDAAIISTKVDGIVYVVRAGGVDRKQLQHATSLLTQVKANVLGYVLNGIKEDADNYYYYYYYGHYSAQNQEPSRRDAKSRRRRKQAPTSPDNPFYSAPKKHRRNEPQLRAPTLPNQMPGQEPQTDQKRMMSEDE
ncbi:MAG: CpsD/CapB family tyrosine-protein kinase [Kiritimatiellae bacterium]|nr:CpsD/CapB family tyrosine-protein kinase [Kiritimatiellia bacterium]